ARSAQKERGGSKVRPTQAGNRAVAQPHLALEPVRTKPGGEPAPPRNRVMATNQRATQLRAQANHKRLRAMRRATYPRPPGPTWLRGSPLAHRATGTQQRSRAFGSLLSANV